jgi:hypothetical protein
MKNDQGLTFPARYTINLLRSEEGTQEVVACRTSNQKVTLENIKYSSVHHISFKRSVRVALLGVYDCETYEELSEKLQYHTEFWNIPKGVALD